MLCTNHRTTPVGTSENSSAAELHQPCEVDDGLQEELSEEVEDQNAGEAVHVGEVLEVAPRCLLEEEEDRVAQRIAQDVCGGHEHEHRVAQAPHQQQ
jgi:hypothetical protein